MLDFQYKNNTKIAVLNDVAFIISCIQDAVDLLGEAGFEGCNSIIVCEKNLHVDFFDLRSGLAGEILQKFSNYRFKLAIIGDFSKYKSKNFQDFVRESNKGKRILFVENIDEALHRLTG